MRNDLARVHQLPESQMWIVGNKVTLSPVDPPSALGEVFHVTMREFGQAVAVSRDKVSREQGIAKVTAMQARLRGDLEANCKTLIVGRQDIANGPTTDIMGRFQSIGFYNTYGSPEMDFFAGLFKCKQAHEGPPTFRLAWSIFKRAITEHRRRRAYEKWAKEHKYSLDYDEWGWREDAV